jgi:hypothetical protein
MNSIIIICNDPHIALVKEALQPLLTAKICILPDFDTGLKEVFEKRPFIVFIQDEIAGVRGETVTRHIKSLLQGSSPQFTQLNHSFVAPGMARTFANGISLSLPPDELVALFRERLEQFPDICWKRGFTQPAEFEPPSPGPDASSSLDETLPSSKPEFISSGADVPVLPLPESGVLPPDDPSSPLSFSEATVSHTSPQTPLSSTCRKGATPESGAPRRADVQELPFPVEPATTVRRKIPLMVGGGGFVALVSGVMLSVLSPFAPNPQGTLAFRHPLPVSSSLNQKPVGAVLPAKLPSFIPPEGLDPAYGAARPGWERYVTPRHEYLLFRDNGVFRALQVIALRQDALDAPFVSSLLQEFSGDGTVVISSNSKSDGYLIEQGVNSRGAEVILYKKKGTGETRGVVVSLP